MSGEQGISTGRQGAIASVLAAAEWFGDWEPAGWELYISEKIERPPGGHKPGQDGAGSRHWTATHTQSAASLVAPMVFRSQGASPSSSAVAHLQYMGTSPHLKQVLSSISISSSTA